MLLFTSYQQCYVTGITRNYHTDTRKFARLSQHNVAKRANHLALIVMLCCRCCQAPVARAVMLKKNNGTCCIFAKIRTSKPIDYTNTVGLVREHKNGEKGHIFIPNAVTISRHFPGKPHTRRHTSLVASHSPFLPDIFAVERGGREAAYTAVHQSERTSMKNKAY